MAKKTRESRADYLNRLLHGFIGDLPHDEGLNVAFKGRGGWMLFGPSRFIGDAGVDFLGTDWRDAEAEIRFLYSAPQDK